VRVRAAARVRVCRRIISEGGGALAGPVRPVDPSSRVAGNRRGWTAITCPTPDLGALTQPLTAVLRGAEIGPKKAHTAQPLCPGGSHGAYEKAAHAAEPALRGFAPLPPSGLAHFLLAEALGGHRGWPRSPSRSKSLCIPRHNRRSLTRTPFTRCSWFLRSRATVLRFVLACRGPVLPHHWAHLPCPTRCRARGPPLRRRLSLYLEEAPSDFARSRAA
jgi:hypothetical protein